MCSQIAYRAWDTNNKIVAHDEADYSPFVDRHVPDRVLWGDTHLHSSCSVDAGFFGTTLVPEDAYRFARGEERRCATEVGNTVNVAEASYTNTIGDPLLTAFWEDPDFDPEQRAFYYARVLEIPKPSWQAYDAKRFGVQMADQVPMIVQDRAYTSPIWFTP